MLTPRKSCPYIVSPAFFGWQQGRRTVAEREQISWGNEHPEDYLLAHNHVQPMSEKQPHGVNGFRAVLRV